MSLSCEGIGLVLSFVPQYIEIFPKYIKLQLVSDVLVLFWMLVLFYFKHRNENIPQSTTTTWVRIISPHILMWPIISFCFACSHLYQQVSDTSFAESPCILLWQGMDIFPLATSHIFNETQVRALCRPFNCIHLGSCVPRETHAEVCCHIGRWGDPVLLLSAWVFFQNLKIFLFIHDSFHLDKNPNSRSWSQHTAIFPLQCFLCLDWMPLPFLQT